MANLLMESPSEEYKLVDYQYEGISKETTFCSLSNGMCLVIAAPSSEINAQANHMLTEIALTNVVVIVIAILMTIIFTKRSVKPLLELTIATRKITDGDLGVIISHESRDEVGTLAESFCQTVAHIITYFDYIQLLAYEDKLTGVKKTTSYVDMIRGWKNASKNMMMHLLHSSLMISII